MRTNKIHNKKDLEAFRKDLRKKLTPSEAYLWKFLKAKQLDGKKFAKQHSIGNYIVDFYLASDKLIIELDGEVHNNPQSEEYDAKRTAYFNSLDFKVIRFENKRVFDDLDGVLNEIKVAFI
ncbi:endonuclease domain-containing protein [Spongiivirga citrea]|uniref:DUF559 domain-containing protein n=1 Tax=Spongiivirga citrea TaxID=1481457 RepID=A0A6M0CJJ4_9FLAO|nr:DUF559 domain-containing protein [Spongiivirga citrea]NER15617.1 DUF559 domain-containing protein [Spongiivirga citrea]